MKRVTDKAYRIESILWLHYWVLQALSLFSWCKALILTTFSSAFSSLTNKWVASVWARQFWPRGGGRLLADTLTEPALLKAASRLFFVVHTAPDYTTTSLAFVIHSFVQNSDKKSLWSLLSPGSRSPLTRSASTLKPETQHTAMAAPMGRGKWPRKKVNSGSF